MQTFFPTLRYQDARAAIEFLERAFGFEARAVHPSGDGPVEHAEVGLGDQVAMLGSDRPDDRWGSRAGLGWIYVAVDDVDAVHARASAAGAEVTPITEQDYGSRDFSARDLEGNQWSFGTYRPEVPAT